MNPYRTAAVCLLVVAAAVCSAKPPFLKVFLATYKVSPNSELGKARCLTCHMPPAPPKRNPYGVMVRDVLFAAKGRMVTPEMLKSIEKKDADGDGISNIDEIKAGTLPGDPKSKPKKKAKKKGKKTAMLDGVKTSAVAMMVVPCFALGGFLMRRPSRN